MSSSIEKDDGREAGRPSSTLPLHFDRVMEGRQLVSSAPLLHVPVEIIYHILLHMEQKSLASLAMVNSDCRQLARSRQFSSIKLDYSDDAVALLLALSAEKQERSRRQQGFTKRPALGSCVRRIIFKTNRSWISRRHHVDTEELMGLDEELMRQRLIVYNSFFDLYLEAFLHVFDDSSVLPHLETLNLEDMMCELPQSFFEALADSSIQHLKFDRVLVEDEFALERSTDSQKPRFWPLKSLHFEVLPVFNKYDRISTYPLATSVLRLCAPTLESLKWESTSSDVWFKRDQTSRAASTDPSIQFPRLKELRIGFLIKTEESLLQAFIHDGLEILEIDTNESPDTRRYFQARGTVRSLKTLVLENFHLSGEDLDFLRSNPQLTALASNQQQCALFLENDLLPLLQSSFHSMRSLCLKWEGLCISDKSLEMISTIDSLEQLHLSAGFQAGWRHDWLIDHNKMRTHLRKLTSLKKLVFSRDSYDNGSGAAHIARYYEDRFPTTEHIRHNIVRDRQGSEKLWEEEHRQRILVEANQYVDLISTLKWMYFGQLFMEVVADGEGTYDFTDYGNGEQQTDEGIDQYYADHPEDVRRISDGVLRGMEFREDAEEREREDHEEVEVVHSDLETDAKPSVRLLSQDRNSAWFLLRQIFSGDIH